MLDISTYRRIGLFFHRGARNRYSRKSPQTLFTPKDNYEMDNSVARCHLVKSKWKLN